MTFFLKFHANDRTVLNILFAGTIFGHSVFYFYFFKEFKMKLNFQ